MSQQAKTMRSQVKKSNVKDKIKLAQNFLHKLRFLSDEVEHTMLAFRNSNHRKNIHVNPFGFSS